MKLFLIIFFASALLLHADDITTSDGKVYKGATILKHDAATATILYADGGATLEIAKLSPELQKKLGYDPAKAAEAVKREQDAALSQQLSHARTEALAERRDASERKKLHIQGTISYILQQGIVLECVAVDPRSTGNTFTIFLRDYPKQSTAADGDSVDATFYPDGEFIDHSRGDAHYHAYTAKLP